MTAAKKSYQPTIESLEDRCVPTTAQLSSGILSIIGKAGADVINVGLAGSKIKVSGVHQSFRAGAVHEILVNTRAGNDFIALDPRLTTPALILCGSGNSTILGDAGNDTVLGTGREVFFSRGGRGTVNGVPQSGLGLTDTAAPGFASTTTTSGGLETTTTTLTFNRLGLAVEQYAARLVGQPAVGAGSATELPPAYEAQDRQCTALVMQALQAAGAQSWFTYDVNGHLVANDDPSTAPYVWGKLIATYHAGESPSILNLVQVGDIIQYQDVVITTTTQSGNTTYTSTSSAPHHTAIVAWNGGNGNLQVIQQNASNVGQPNLVRQDAESFSGMSQGTIWVYRPEAA
jgi:hypothetical protein